MRVQVRSAEEVRNVVDPTVEELGGVDILVNNAGTRRGLRPQFRLTSAVPGGSCKPELAAPAA
jgi:NAD(P)-dependent dehydrogenase (short-subunit alcohol dehydrogenase family)